MSASAQPREQPRLCVLDTLEAQMRAADKIAPRLDLHGHNMRVAAVAGELARAIGYGEREAALLERASYFHDVGKIALPKPLLLANRALTIEEQALIASHCEIGAAWLRDAGDPCADLAASIALLHHNRYDGAGHAEGPAGEDIPIASRIVAVADVYDAIRSERPYKAPLSHAETASRLLHGDHRLKVGAFDPTLIEAFCDRQYAISERWDCVALRLLTEKMRALA